MLQNSALSYLSTFNPLIGLLTLSKSEGGSLITQFSTKLEVGVEWGERKLSVENRRNDLDGKCERKFFSGLEGFLGRISSVKLV